jgi:hypothetical protein
MDLRNGQSIRSRNTLLNLARNEIITRKVEISQQRFLLQSIICRVGVPRPWHGFSIFFSVIGFVCLLNYRRLDTDFRSCHKLYLSATGFPTFQLRYLQLLSFRTTL